ncbi:DUF3048 domain-containing protein [Evansella tamaricis]|uniref:DUF3048 domain-containing protein n=1 Tax=Evansella tamaricis TaxID=2069301 RepID=A0ABS6J978_9BACI|nr:DUF3048 domain-containing protein [Evansella tamaricis]MBU9710237.1 DUF3048 domain-containing protein [Evansella tamaricis]
MQIKKNVLVSLFTFIILPFVACSSDVEDVSIINDLEERTISLELKETPDAPFGYYPLTGMEIKEEMEVDYRAFGVMIENSMAARPQSGLYQADVVYEILSEGTITRFLAIFHSQKPERIGPLRSARSYYVHLNKGMDSIYVNAGGSPGGLSLAESSYVDNINALIYDGRFFSRSTDRVAPHNMYTTYDDLVAAAESIGYEMDRLPPKLHFVNKLAEVEGELVKELEVNYGSPSNNVQYKYDEGSKRYLRYIGGQPSNDLETGEPVAPKNIFIVEASHRVIPKGEDHIDAGSQRREIDIDSGGNAYLIQEGILQEVEWVNENGILLPYKNGELLPFLPGQTWVNIVPSGSGGLQSNVNLLLEE